MSEPDKAFIVAQECEEIFDVVETANLARAATLRLSHGSVRAPVFMPVGTQGAIKGITFDQMKTQLDCEILLANTYHLGLRPGEELLRDVGGLHKLAGWNRSMLTDSGGFQMVSLLPLANITEDGVSFASSHDDTRLLLRPEDSMRIQNAIGADIIMQLDDVVHVRTTGPRVEEAMHRSIRWLDRCIASHQAPKSQHLFAIIQGGTDLDLRSHCVREMTRRNCPGYAIGGLSGGEAKEVFWRVVARCTAELPRDKPRYVMGVGYPVDIVVCVALGADMFDCVYPTRTARFGTALTSRGLIHIGKPHYAADCGPLESGCTCVTCCRFTRQQLHKMSKQGGVIGSLLSLHNLHYMLTLMRAMRQSIVSKSFSRFVTHFMVDYFSAEEEQFLSKIEISTNCSSRGTISSERYQDRYIPEWVYEALSYAGIDLRSEIMSLKPENVRR